MIIFTLLFHNLQIKLSRCTSSIQGLLHMKWTNEAFLNMSSLHRSSTISEILKRLFLNNSQVKFELLCWIAVMSLCPSSAFCNRQPATAKWYDRRDSVFVEFCVEDSKDVNVHFDKSKMDFRYDVFKCWIVVFQLFSSSSFPPFPDAFFRNQMCDIMCLLFNK